jgi:hypothetical protein
METGCQCGKGLAWYDHTQTKETFTDLIIYRVFFSDPTELSHLTFRLGDIVSPSSDDNKVMCSDWARFHESFKDSLTDFVIFRRREMVKDIYQREGGNPQDHPALMHDVVG